MIDIFNIYDIDICFICYAGHSGGPAAISGSDPLPGETEPQYVARQRQLQAEVGAVPVLY
jgi:hypothetical protein